MKFINKKIYEAYGGNIGNGLIIKKLLMIKFHQKIWFINKRIIYLIWFYLCSSKFLFFFQYKK